MNPGPGLLLASLLLVVIHGGSAMSQSPLKECPQSPNCVSTLTRQADKRMAPIALTVDADTARAAIKSVVLSMPRTRLLAETDDYLHFTFRSWLFRFVDDVEFYLDGEAGVVHFRSASRTGHGDLGVNRKRMTRLGERIAAALR